MGFKNSWLLGTWSLGVGIWAKPELKLSNMVKLGQHLNSNVKNVDWSGFGKGKP